MIQNGAPRFGLWTTYLFLRFALIGVFAAITAFATPLILDAPQTIGSWLALLCRPGEPCEFAPIYGGFAVALVAMIGFLIVIGSLVRDMLAFEFDEDDENTPDIVFDDLVAAKKHPKLTPAQLCERTGLDRLTVQNCLQCLIEDGKVIRFHGGTEKDPFSLFSYSLAGAAGERS